MIRLLRRWLEPRTPGNENDNKVITFPTAGDQHQDFDNFEQARQLHAAGRWEDAESLYLALNAKFPMDGDILLQLGLLYGQSGQYEKAVAPLEQLIATNPRNAAAQSTLGNVYGSMGRNAEAIVCYDAALALAPDNADIWCNRGAALRELGLLDESLASIEGALVRQPSHAMAIYNKGLTALKQGQTNAALISFKQVIAAAPDNTALIEQCLRQLPPPFHTTDALTLLDFALSHTKNTAQWQFERGVLLQGIGQHTEALASYDAVLAVDARHATAHANRGIALRALNQSTAALEALERACALAPESALAHYNRGVVLLDLFRLDDALLALELTLTLDATIVDAWNNRGNALKALRRFDEALVSYSRGIEIDPHYAPVRFSRAALLFLMSRHEEAAADFAAAANIDPDTDHVLGHLLESHLFTCDWGKAAECQRKVENEILLGRKTALPSSIMGAIDNRQLLFKCASTQAMQFVEARVNVNHAVKRPNAKTRVGYIAGEFRHHATSLLAVELFEKHDRSRFEIFAFDSGWNDRSAMRQRLQKAFVEIVDISRLPTLDAAEQIRMRGIDVLIDLNGHVGYRRTDVIAQMAAPVQANWLGFPGTMAAPFIDYIIADPVVIPPEHEADYSERIIRLPHCYQPNDRSRIIGESSISRESAKLPPNGFVFCCFNNNYKIQPRIFDIWMRLLLAVDESVLWLLECSDAAKRNLRAAASARGVQAERLIFAPRVELAEHLARHRLANLFLDTLPCNAHTTASDALWAGLPMVTCLGESFAGRVGGSLLRAVNLPDMVTNSLEEYEALALKLAHEPEYLHHTQRRLSASLGTCPLFDSTMFTRHFEAALDYMVGRSRSGLPPQTHDIPTE